MNFANLATRASKFAMDNSPTILTAIGVVGVVTTAVLAGKASFTAADIIRIKEADDDERGVTLGDPRDVLKDRIKLTWKLYIPAGLTCVATAACIIGADRIGSRRAAGLAAAYSIVEKASEEYKAKVVEKIGERKEQQVRDEIIQDRITETWDDSIEIHGKKDGEVFYDKFSDRYVWTTQEGVRAAINELNQTIVGVGYATAADFYYLLDMPAPVWSTEIGWNSNDRLMQARFSSHLTPGGKPVNAFEFDADPTRNYTRFH